MQTVISHILADCEENYSPEEEKLSTAPLPRPLLSAIQMKGVEHVLGNSSVVLKPPLICVRDLRSSPRTWLFVLYIQIPGTIKTKCNPLPVRQFHSYQ